MVLRRCRHGPGDVPTDGNRYPAGRGGEGGQGPQGGTRRRERHLGVHHRRAPGPCPRSAGVRLRLPVRLTVRQRPAAGKCAARVQGTRPRGRTAGRRRRAGTAQLGGAQARTGRDVGGDPGSGAPSGGAQVAVRGRALCGGGAPAVLAHLRDPPSPLRQCGGRQQGAALGARDSGLPARRTAHAATGGTHGRSRGARCRHPDARWRRPGGGPGGRGAAGRSECRGPVVAVHVDGECPLGPPCGRHPMGRPRGAHPEPGAAHGPRLAAGATLRSAAASGAARSPAHARGRTPHVVAHP